MIKLSAKTAKGFGVGVIAALVPFFFYPVSGDKTGFDLVAHDHFISGHLEQAEDIITIYDRQAASKNHADSSRDCMGLEYKIDKLEEKRLNIISHPSLPERDRNRLLQEVADQIKKLDQKLLIAQDSRGIALALYKKLSNKGV